MPSRDDLKYSLRLLSKTPGFTLVTLAILTIGLSLYISSYTFSEMITDKPMPFPNGEHYVSLKTVDTQSNSETGQENHDAYSFNRIDQSAQSYAVLGAFARTSSTLSDGDYARRYSGGLISPQLLEATSVQPAVGRMLTPEDSEPGASPVVMMGHSLWQDYYAGAMDIVGRTSLIDGEPYTVVGVLPDGFSFPLEFNYWLPLQVSDSAQPGEGNSLTLTGILEPNVTLEAAEVELNSLMRQIALDFPEFYDNRYEMVLPYASIQWDRSNPVFDIGFMSMLVTSLILILLTVNLSSLLFVRSGSREQELTVRSSVGATRWQLVQQVLVESLIICSVGFLLSLILSSIILRLFGTEFVAGWNGLPFWFDFNLNVQAVSNGLVTTAIIWIVSGSAVAYKTYSSDPSQLFSSSKSLGKSGKGLSIQLIVFAETILSFFLLICCGLLVVATSTMTNVDFGVNPDNKAYAFFDLSHSDYADSQRKLNYVGDLRQSILEIPGVRAASVTSGIPGRRGLPGTYSIDETDATSENQLPAQNSIWIESSYFETIEIPILEGRAFDSNDNANSDPVVIISEAFAQRLWEGESAIGKRLRSINTTENQWLTVVGVIPDILQASFPGPAAEVPSMYRPLAQGNRNLLGLIVQHDPQLTIDDLRTPINLAAANADRNIPLMRMRSLKEEQDSFTGVTSLIGQIFVTYSLTTLILATIGIYSVIARSIALETHRIGVCRAVGSSDFEIIGRYLKKGLGFLLGGAIVGGIPASVLIIVALNSIDQELHQNSIVLSALISTIVGVLFVIITLASYLPARKAVALEPGDALRYE